MHCRAPVESIGTAVAAEEDRGRGAMAGDVCTRGVDDMRQIPTSE